jgi:YIF1
MSYYNSSNTNAEPGTGGGSYYGSQPTPSSTVNQGKNSNNNNINNNNNNTFHQGYGDPNTWQQQQQQQSYEQPQTLYGQQPSYPVQQQQMYPMQPSQQPQQQQPNVMNSFWDPATAARMAAMAVNMSSNSSAGGNGGMGNEAMMLNLAGEASKSFLQSKSAQLLPGYMEQIMNVLRTYFAVDNRYVVLKMKRLLVPFLCKHWKRQVRFYSIMLFLRHLFQTVLCFRTLLR